VASTGVIGQKLSLDPIISGMPELVSGLSSAPESSFAAAEAIMTTDTVAKELSYEFDLGDIKCKIGAICKGVGMICPNMATMLMFITTDVNITPQMLQRALSADVKDSVNMVSVDRDTSTNDTLCIMANGLAGNAIIDRPDTDYKKFTRALHAVTTEMCRRIAADGEGATKLIECKVSGAKSKQVARTVAKSVVCSDLLKAAMFGADANWGRVLCAIGYSGADVDISKISVVFSSAAGKILVCENGMGVDFSEPKAKEILSEKEVKILIGVGTGNYTATAWGCDLTYEYVHINGDYRS
jgi:glutamate N-acetyltransferase/amino-acid N-acetyltransferase